MLVTSIFSVSHNVFYSICDKVQFLRYIYFVICKCFQFGAVQNFVVYLRVIPLFHREWFKYLYALVNPFPNKPWFVRVCSTSPLKTLWEKEKLLVMSNFSFCHSVFYRFRELSVVFIKFKIVVCKLFQFGRV